MPVRIEAAAATRAAGGRRAAIDVARVLALAVVVLGHLLLAVVDRAPDGNVRGANLLALLPGWTWVAAAAPMPVFFAAAGWANATARLGAAAPRLRALVGVAAVVALWAMAVVAATLAAGDPGIVAAGARISTQPLWFLAAYLPLAASGPPLARIAARRPVAWVGGCLVLLAALDLGRFWFGAPDWIAWLGFYAVWGIPWLAGAWWRDRWEHRAVRERAVGLLLLSSAGLAAAALVVSGVTSRRSSTSCRAPGPTPRRRRCTPPLPAWRRRVA